MSKYMFTSESVSEGHPDKVADHISDAVLDAMIAEDSNARVACETLVTTDQVVVAGEVRSEARLDIEALVRQVIADIGYCDPELGFDARSCAILVALGQQSPDIAQGVNAGEGPAQGRGCWRSRHDVWLCLPRNPPAHAAADYPRARADAASDAAAQGRANFLSAPGRQVSGQRRVRRRPARARRGPWCYRPNTTPKPLTRRLKKT